MRLSRRRLTLGRGKLLKMPGSGGSGGDRGKLSFFIVVIFLAVFGIIILAEVLFMDEQHHGPGGKQGVYASGKLINVYPALIQVSEQE